MAEVNGGGKLSIKTQKIEDNVRISFTDDGLGIPVEYLSKLFDPFFTTRGGRKVAPVWGLVSVTVLLPSMVARYMRKARREKEPPSLLSCRWHKVTAIAS